MKEESNIDKNKLTDANQSLLNRQSTAFQDDVAEGLNHIINAEELKQISDNINHSVRNKISKKKNVSKNNKLFSMPLWVLIFIIIVLILLSYFTIHFSS